jgi:hypothetical protein
MVDWKNRKLGDVLTFANGFVFILLINLLVGLEFYRVDLTEEKRYSVKQRHGLLLNALTTKFMLRFFWMEN